MYRLIFFSLIAVVVLSCKQQGVSTIDAEQLKKLQSDGVVVVDIRTTKEFERGHIPGVMHIDYRENNFLDLMSKIDKNEPVVIYCASGGRSGSASGLLSSEGFSMIYDYSGGFADWSGRGEQIEK